MGSAGIAWIDRQGGIEQAAEQIANDTEHSDRHVATLVRRHVLNSEFAASLPDEIRMAVELKNISEGTAWGREGAARRLAALTLKSIDSVKALFRKLHENMPDKEKVKPVFSKKMIFWCCHSATSELSKGSVSDSAPGS